MATTLVAKGSKISGKITGDSPIHVAGELDGSIEVDQAVLVSTEGHVDGDIRARTVRIGGKVTGDVRATEKVEVTPSGALEGNIRAPRVILEEGAFFKGQVEMAGEGSKKGQGAGRRPAAEPPPAQRRPAAGTSESEKSDTSKGETS